MNLPVELVCKYDAVVSRSEKIPALGTYRDSLNSMVAPT